MIWVNERTARMHREWDVRSFVLKVFALAMMLFLPTTRSVSDSESSGADASMGRSGGHGIPSISKSAAAAAAGETLPRLYADNDRRERGIKNKFVNSAEEEWFQFVSESYALPPAASDPPPQKTTIEDGIDSEAPRVSAKPIAASDQKQNTDYYPDSEGDNPEDYGDGDLDGAEGADLDSHVHDSESKSERTVAGQTPSHTMIDRYAARDSRFWIDLVDGRLRCGSDLVSKVLPKNPSSKLVAKLKKRATRDGFFKLPKLGGDWPDLIERLRDGIMKLREKGFDPTWIMMYDEAWAVVHTLSRVQKLVWGNDFCFDTFAWFVDPSIGQGGWGVHRDRVTVSDSAGNKDTGFRPADDPEFPLGAKYSTFWVALTSATPENSCLHFFPAHLDVNYYNDTENPHINTIARHDQLPFIRAVPAEAGEVIMFSHRIMHWGSTGTDPQAEPRIAIGFAHTKDDYERAMFKRDAHLPSPEVHVRLTLVAALLLRYLKRRDSKVFVLQPDLVRELFHMVMFHAPQIDGQMLEELAANTQFIENELKIYQCRLKHQAGRKSGCGNTIQVRSSEPKTFSAATVTLDWLDSLELSERSRVLESYSKQTRALQQYDASATFLEQVIAIESNNGKFASEQIAYLLQDVGQIYLQGNETVRATNAYARSEAILTDLYGPQHDGAVAAREKLQQLL